MYLLKYNIKYKLHLKCSNNLLNYWWFFRQWSNKCWICYFIMRSTTSAIEIYMTKYYSRKAEFSHRPAITSKTHRPKSHFAFLCFYCRWRLHASRKFNYFHQYSLYLTKFSLNIYRHIDDIKVRILSNDVYRKSSIGIKVSITCPNGKIINSRTCSHCSRNCTGI